MRVEKTEVSSTDVMRPEPNSPIFGDTTSRGFVRQSTELELTEPDTKAIPDAIIAKDSDRRLKKIYTIIWIGALLLTPFAHRIMSFVV